MTSSAQPIAPRYPSSAEIKAYHPSHPIFKTGIDTVEKTILYAPGIIARLADLFGGKEVSDNNVDGIILTAIRAAAAEEGDQDKTKLVDLWIGVTKFTEETKDNTLQSDLNSDNAGVKLLTATIAICRNFLKDAQAGASFQPPKPGTTNWIRIVPKD